MALERPSSVLFACNFNRVRSPMAEALAKLIYGGRIRVDSCGLRAGGDMDGFMVAAIDEIGVDLSGRQGKSFDELGEAAFDLVISLTPEAQHRAVEMSRGRPTEIEYWPTPDPTLATGSREQLLAAYRDVREMLRARILERFGKPSTFGG